jgi:hypothetical protein
MISFLFQDGVSFPLFFQCERLAMDLEGMEKNC